MVGFELASDQKRNIIIPNPHKGFSPLCMTCHINYEPMEHGFSVSHASLRYNDGICSLILMLVVFLVREVEFFDHDSPLLRDNNFARKP